MQHILIYITVESEDEGRAIARELLSQKLVACANMLPAHKALYTWQGEMEEGTEHIVLLKTRKDLFKRVEQEICRLHSYECPCIIALPVKDGHAPFLEWISQSTIDRD
jgi:periplasmic divalent cation tolerance protein